MKLMKAASPNAITPELIRAYRNDNVISMSKFWGDIGCSLSRGHHYETEKTPMRDETKRLIYVHYVAGIPIDLKSTQFTETAKYARKLGKA